MRLCTQPQQVEERTEEARPISDGFVLMLSSFDQPWALLCFPRDKWMRFLRFSVMLGIDMEFPIGFSGLLADARRASIESLRDSNGVRCAPVQFEGISNNACAWIGNHNRRGTSAVQDDISLDRRFLRGVSALVPARCHSLT